MKRSAIISLLSLLSLAAAGRAQKLPSKAVLQTVSQSVYEVVIPKPEKDPLTYEKPLPFDLLPFKVRNDKFYSVGSAFAINESLLVTAAHVLSLNYSTLLAPHMVRDAAGNTYAIKSISAFSSYRDFVAFTIDSRLQLKPVRAGLKYSLNQGVFAVGNAYGDGTVIRDGLLTSTSPEREEGAFEELRFSAAASPGNSGGPLLDATGTAIGMVIRKSEGENLNYALPIGEILNNLGKPAEIYYKIIYGLPNNNFQKPSTIRSALPLPAPVGGFREKLTTIYIDACRLALDSLLIENRDANFPNGNHSQNLLHSLVTTNFPNLIAQGKDGSWSVYGSNDIQGSDLDDNGRLYVARGMFGYDFFQLNLPDSIGLVRLAEDDGLMMDYLLKGLELYRTIGNSRTRIVSLGLPTRRETKKDRYSRVWLVRSWDIAFSDERMVIYALPVPSGLVGYCKRANVGHFDAGLLPDMDYLMEHIYLSYYGTMPRWTEFMAQPGLIPKAFQRIRVDYVLGKSISVSTPRLIAKQDKGVFPVDDESDLQLKFSYFLEEGKVIWDLGGITFGENKNNNNCATVIRQIKPAKGVSEATKSAWQKIAYQQYPYDQSVSISDDRTMIIGLHPSYKKYGPAEKFGRPVLYTTSVVVEGKRDDGLMESKLKKFNNNISILEQ